LEYARVRKKTIPEKTNVNELVHDIVETIVPRNFKVEITELPVLNTEKIKLEQIFTNLISNSVKYSEPDNGYIGINCQENEHHYEFSVRDKGIGIEPEYHHKIFEIFQTLRDENDKESTGIGLAIIKKILEDQNSTITLNSSPGIGSEFTFTWPKH
jgi:signal transduction histidine kinase